MADYPECAVCGEKIAVIYRTCEVCGFHFHSIACEYVGNIPPADGRTICRKCRQGLCRKPGCMQPKSEIIARCKRCKYSYCDDHYGFEYCDLCTEELKK